MTLAELNKQYQHRDRLVDAEIDKLRAAGVEENFEDHLQQRLSADIYPSDWVRQIVHPIAKQIEDAGGFARVKVLGPMGIGARVSLHCYQNDGDSIDDIRSITFARSHSNPTWTQTVNPLWLWLTTARTHAGMSRERWVR